MGQMFVRLIELGDAKRMLASTTQVSFADMSFDEAVEFWRARGGSPEMLDRILRAYRRDAATAGDLFLDVIARKAVSQLDTALTSGGSIAGFVEAIQDEQVAFGTDPSSPGYLETVYRTNVATAYGAGRYRQILTPEVMEARPWVQYRTADDGRVRPSHEALDMTVYRIDAESWRSIAPPNGYNCRCSVVTLDDEEASGYQDNKRDSPPAEADPGFNQPPTDPIA